MNMIDPIITMTPKAVKHVKSVQADDESAKNAALRIQVIEGGCSGMSYDLKFEQTAPQEQDKMMEIEGIRIIIDSRSALFISGMQLDFSDGLNGTGFVFNNPNAKRTCGCGTSFSA